MTAFDKYLANIVEQAGHEAHKDRAATFEAQHLLLAVAGDQEPTTRQVLASAGLDYDAIRGLLDRELERSLSAAGVTVTASELPRSSAGLGDPKPGTSAKLAMERGFSSVARKKDLRPAHLLLGIMRARKGTVPRALALGGVDQADLETRIVQALDADRQAEG